MERRYRLLHANHARNITDFNKKVEVKAPLKGPRATLATQAGIQKELPFDAVYSDGILPYIVLILDELADLMLTVQGEIETPLAVLAQKARAIGIHLILATQRPSVNVITGLIKANFPCRIAFRVAAKVDSRTILDQNGAETLLGNGDMLFLPPGKSEPMRVQGAYISTDETERVMEWYRKHAAAAAVAATPGSSIDEQVAALEKAEKEGEEGGGKGEGDFGERDPLFRQAAEVCIQNQLGSTSLLQRRMSIGYGRAARIIDQLELAGVLGPPNGSKPRDVLVDLVARRGHLVAFFEVKARRGTAFGSPFEAVTGAKRREIVKAARVWMDRYGRPEDVYRFDCIALVDNKLEHLEDAFRPGWR